MKLIKSIACAALAFAFVGIAGCTNNSGTTDDKNDGNGNTTVTPEQPETPEKKEDNFYIRADKDRYCADEDVFIVAGGGEDSRVSITKSDGTESITYSVNKDGMRSGMRKIIDVKTQLSVGEYTATLYADGGNEIKASTRFSVVNNAVYTDKNEYYSNEEIVVTGYGGENSWVGLYKANDVPTSTRSILWYYLQKDTHLAGHGYILQRTAKNSSEYSPLSAGEYKIVLFDNDAQSSSVAETRFTVKAGNVGRAQAPLSGEFVPDVKGSGTMSGSLMLTLGENNGYASEITAYWANADGVLEDYLAFAPLKVEKNPFAFTALENVYIPEEATKLRFYGANLNGLSEEYFELDVTEQKAASSQLKWSYNVISDIHISTATTHSGKQIYNEHFRQACKDIVATAPDSKAMFIVGDIANSGLAAEWELAADIIAGTDGMPKTYYTLGNHDLYEERTPYDEKIQIFLKYSGASRAYYEEIVEDTHHFVLGSQAQQTDNDSKVGASGVDAIILDDQLNWLETRLEEIKLTEGEKPVFVYCHQSMFDTIAGSLKGHKWDGVRPEEKLKTILAKHPNVIMFNGHSHWIMQSYRNAYFASDKAPNIFNTSSAGYLWSTTDKEVSVEGSQGYFIRVYENKIVILGRDFVNEKWIPEAGYVIEV